MSPSLQIAAAVFHFNRRYFCVLFTKASVFHNFFWRMYIYILSVCVHVSVQIAVCCLSHISVLSWNSLLRTGSNTYSGRAVTAMVSGQLCLFRFERQPLRADCILTKF